MLHGWWVEGGKSDSDDKEISQSEGGKREKVEVWMEESVSLVVSLLHEKWDDKAVSIWKFGVMVHGRCVFVNVSAYLTCLCLPVLMDQTDLHKLSDNTLQFNLHYPQS